MSSEPLFRCPKCGHRRKRRYCKFCKAENERRRYAKDPKAQRERKRREYAEKKRGRTRVDCQHNDATQDDAFPGVFFCPDCGQFLNEAGEVVADPTAPQTQEEKPSGRKRRTGGSKAGKVPSPPEKRAYQRDPSKMVTVKCTHPHCSNKWEVWPQNVYPEMLCPTLHLPLLKQQQARERQRRHRQRLRQAQA